MTHQIHIYLSNPVLIQSSANSIDQKADREFWLNKPIVLAMLLTMSPVIVGPVVGQQPYKSIGSFHGEITRSTSVINSACANWFTGWVRGELLIFLIVYYDKDYCNMYALILFHNSFEYGAYLYYLEYCICPPCTPLPPHLHSLQLPIARIKDWLMKLNRLILHDHNQLIH